MGCVSVSIASECKMGHTVKPSSQRFRGIETWENCRDKCNEDDQCSHFKYKDHRRARRRLCILMDTVFEEKEAWTAGEQFCIDDGSTSTSTETPSTDHDCKVGFTLKSIWIEKQRGSIETWEDCRDKCNDDNEYHPGNNNNQHWPCTHFKFKDNRKNGKCVLMTFFLFEEKNSWTSGEKFCSTSTTEPPVPLDKAIIVTGGDSAEFDSDIGGWVGGTSVELLHEDGTPWCSLPDLPQMRQAHTQTGLEACGGHRALTTCVRFSGGSWTLSHNLQQRRESHTSWASPGGTVLLGGTFNSTNTTELLADNSLDSSNHFTLKYNSTEGCSIDMGDQVIITGGLWMGGGRVTVYNSLGFVADWPSLKIGRFQHGCGHFVNKDNKVVYLVVGGHIVTGDSGLTATTEILVAGESSWNEVGPLPLALSGLGVVSIHKNIFSTGGHDGGDGDDGDGRKKSIFKFDRTTLSWSQGMPMNMPRYYHGVTVVNVADVQDFCT